MKTLEELSTVYGKMHLLEAEGDPRRNRDKKPVMYSSEGHIVGLYLEEALQVATSVGTFSAEALKFYEEGSLKRLFPLDGKINGYWTEQDERKLATPLSFKTPTFLLTACCISLYFYPSGKLKSLTLWPGEKGEVYTAYGTFPFRTGISFYEEGTIKSFEPAVPIILETPIGKMQLFDLNACGVNGDLNSVTFDEKGQLASCMTALTTVTIKKEGQIIKIFEPRRYYGEIIPLVLHFDEEELIINGKAYAKAAYAFEVEPMRFRPLVKEKEKAVASLT